MNTTCTSARQDGSAGEQDPPQGTQLVLPLQIFRVIGGCVTLAEQVRGGYILPDVSSSSGASVPAGTGDGVFHSRGDLQDMFNTRANKAKRQRPVSIGIAASLGFEFVPECKWFVCLRCSHSPPKEATAQPFSVLYMAERLRGVREHATRVHGQTSAASAKRKVPSQSLTQAQNSGCVRGTGDAYSRIRSLCRYLMYILRSSMISGSRACIPVTRNRSPPLLPQTTCLPTQTCCRRV
jgi:hypothetical protein